MVIRKPHHGLCDEKLVRAPFFVAWACSAFSSPLVAAFKHPAVAKPEKRPKSGSRRIPAPD
jgi:hypothetical protein